MSGNGLNSQQRFEKRPEELEIESICAIRPGISGIVMDLDEEPVDAGGYRGAGQKWNELWLPSADAVGGRRLLYGVRRIEDDGRQIAHDGERTEINHEIVVAERRAALG